MAKCQDYQECYIFVDHSNLWIAGQVAYASKLQDANSDKRYRVDLGRFLNLLIQERQLAKAFLYGSVPPPNDSVWRAAKEKNFEVKTFQRSAGSGREKELDVAMAHDITKNLYMLKHTGNDKNVVFITVTGDRDLKPPIEDTLENGVPVELWSWENSLARDFRQLANTNDLFSVSILDNVQSKFSFTAYMSRHHKTDIDPEHAIVFRDVPRGKRFFYEFTNHIARLMRLFYITSHDSEKENKQNLIVEFPNTKPEKVLKMLSKLGEFDHKPCSYPEYVGDATRFTPSKIRKDLFEAKGDIDDSSLPEVVESSLSADIIDLAHSDTSTENTEEDNWVTVVRRKAGKMTYIKRRRDMECRSKEHCRKGRDCPYKHSDYEKKLFDRFRSGIRFHWKTKLCDKLEKHTTQDQRKWCEHAHEESDSWCLKCMMYGHLTDDCKV